VLHNHGRDSLSRILGSAYQSGLRSGLTVQRHYADRMSWLACSRGSTALRGCSPSCAPLDGADGTSVNCSAAMGLPNDGKDLRISFLKASTPDLEIPAGMAL